MVFFFALSSGAILLPKLDKFSQKARSLAIEENDHKQSSKEEIHEEDSATDTLCERDSVSH
jgi:hypothetical protein